MDAISSAQTSSASTTLSWSHTTTASYLNTLLVVTVQAGSNSTVSGVTYNGVALTNGVARQQGTNLDVEIWYLLRPSAGTHSVVVTHSASNDLIGGAMTFYNVAQSGTFGTFRSVAGNSVGPATQTTSGTYPTANDLIIDAVASKVTTLTVGGSQNQRWKLTQTAGFSQGATSTLPGTGVSQSMSWTLGASDKWAIALVPIFNCTPPAAGGTASLTTTPINEGSTAQLNLSGHTSAGTTVQWQVSTDNVTFTDIAGGTGTPYTTAVISWQGTYYYRARVYDNTTLCFIYSTTTTLTVNSGKCLTTGTAVSGAGAVTIAAETKYIANDAVLSGNVTMNNAASVFRINDVCGGSLAGSWTGKFAADPTAGAKVYIYGSINNATDWTIGAGGATFNIYSTGSITVNSFNFNGLGNYTFNNYGTITTTGDFKLTGNGTLTINNYGTITIGGTYNSNTNGTLILNNYSSGIFNVNDILLNGTGGGTITNYGKINVTQDFIVSGTNFVVVNNDRINCRDFTANGTGGSVTNNNIIDCSRDFTLGGNIPYNMGSGSLTNVGRDFLNNGTGKIWGPPASGNCSAFKVVGVTNNNAGTIDATNSSRVDVCDAGSPPGGMDFPGTANSTTFCVCTVALNKLPITLLYFNAQRVSDNHVALNWATATETNNDYFTIEKSSNGKDFMPIVQNPGAGNSASLIKYSTDDYEALQGTSYYRLKQTDYDGKFEYSKIVAVSNNKVVNSIIYPNPSQGGPVNISINGVNDNEVLMVLYDSFGRTVYSKMTVNESSNGLLTTTLNPGNKLSPGIYYIVATSKQELFRKVLVVSEEK